MSEIYSANKEENSANSLFNSLDFMIEKSIKNLVNTAILVRVESVDTEAKKLVCKPLVSQYDASGKVLDSAILYDIPYMRYQGGKAAIICNPCVNDIGLAIFAQQDISLVTSNKIVQPASFRAYDMADALYIGGFINNNPEIFIELNQDGQILIEGSEKISLKAPKIAIEAEDININADVSIQGKLTVSDDVLSSSKSLVNHIHSGVQSGTSFTGKPT